MESNPMQRGQAWIEQLFKLANLPVTASAEDPQAHGDDSCWLTLDSKALSPEQIEALIGRGGNSLDSLQYLINATLNMGVQPEEQQPYTVELANYRTQRLQELQDMAEEAIAHVRESGAEYEITSLSSAERRQVHTFLKDFDDLETFSRGQEPDRRLVVKLKGDAGSLPDEESDNA